MYSFLVFTRYFITAYHIFAGNGPSQIRVSKSLIVTDTESTPDNLLQDVIYKDTTFGNLGTLDLKVNSSWMNVGLIGITASQIIITREAWYDDPEE